MLNNPPPRSNFEDEIDTTPKQYQDNIAKARSVVLFFVVSSDFEEVDNCLKNLKQDIFRLRSVFFCLEDDFNLFLRRIILLLLSGLDILVPVLVPRRESDESIVLLLLLLLLFG